MHQGAGRKPAHQAERDRAVRQYALALHRSGQTTEALRVVREHVRVLVDEFELDEDQLTPEATLYEELDFDSLDAVDLIAALEREFGMKIDRQEAVEQIGGDVPLRG